MCRVVRKPAFCICETKKQISFAVTAKLISAFVFAIRIVQSLYYLNPKFQASSHLLWPYSLVCVGPGRKPRRPVFSQEAHIKVGVSYTEMLACLCFTGQQTRTLTDLVTKIKQTAYLTTHQQKFDAFVFGLLK